MGWGRGGGLVGGVRGVGVVWLVGRGGGKGVVE